MSDESFERAWKELSANSGEGYIFLREPQIVGWAVFTKGIEQAAMYNLDQRQQAFDAAKRWGASIQALVLHPESPDLTVTDGRVESEVVYA